MNVVSLAILPVSAECVEVLEDVGVVAPLLDIAGARVMVEVLVVVVVPPDVAVCRPEAVATAGHQFVDEMKCHMRMEMEPGKDVEAGAELGRLDKNFRYTLKCLELCFLCLELVTTI